MPQLDFLTYFTQYTWFRVFFILFYFRVVISFLPAIATTLKLRKKIKEEGVREWTAVEAESRQVLLACEQLKKDRYSVTSKSIAKEQAVVQGAAEQALQTILKDRFASANLAYLQGVYETTVAPRVYARVLASGK